MNAESDLVLLKHRLNRLEEDLRSARAAVERLEVQLHAAAMTPPPADILPPAAPVDQPTPDPVAVEAPVAETPEVILGPVVAEDRGGSMAPAPGVVEPPPLPAWAVVTAMEPKPEEAGAAAFPPNFWRQEGMVEPASHQADLSPQPAEPPALKTWLMRLQLWPPSGDGNREAQLGAWWATRVGMLLAVIGVVFFAVYVSRNTPPWVRFTELLAASVGVALLGLRLERKIEKFGAVVFAGGLALIYFCAFAAYGVAPVKVLTNVVAASGWQLAAVALFVGAAVWRRSPLIATMGTGLGYVTAMFSHAEGLHDLALAAAWLLAAVAVVFHRWQRWEAPSVIALPATYAVYALVLVQDWPGHAPSRGWVWLLLTAAGAMFFARDWRARRVPAAEVTAGEQWFQVLNSTLLVLAGAATAELLYSQHFSEFYFGAAAVLGVGAWRRRRQVEDDAVAAILAAKAAGLFTLGVIHRADANTVALALLIQAWIMLYSSRRLQSRVLAWGTGVVGLIATGFFARDAAMPMDAWSWAAVSAVGFLAGLALLGPEAARRLLPGEHRNARQGVEAMAAALAGGLGAVTALHWRPEPWVPALAAGLGVALALAGWARRAWGPALAGVLVLLAATLALWQAALPVGPGGPRLWWNAFAVLAPTVALGAICGGRRAAAAAAEAAEQMAVAGAAAWALAVAGAAVVFFNQWPATEALAATAMLGLGLAAAYPALPERPMPWLATLAPALGVAFWLGDGADVTPAWGVLAAAALLWALLVGPRALPRQAALLARDPGAALVDAIRAGLAVIVTLKACEVLLSEPERVLAYGVIATAICSFVWRPGVAAALPTSWVFWLAAWWTALPAFGRQTDVGMRVPPILAVLLAWVPAVALERSKALGAFGKNEAWWRRVGGGAQIALATLGAVVVGAAYFPGGERLVALTVAALGIAALLPVLPTGRLSWPATLVAVLGVAAWLAAGADSNPRWMVAAGALGLWLLPVAPSALPHYVELKRREPDEATLDAVQVGLAAFVTLHGCSDYFPGSASALALVALGVGSLWWWPGLAAALPASWLFWLAAWWNVAASATPDAPGWSTLAALLAWVPALALTHGRDVPGLGDSEAWWRRTGIGVQVTLAVTGAVVVALVCFHGADQLGMLTAAVAIATLVLRVGAVPLARNGAGALAGVAWLTAMRLVALGGAEGPGAGLAGVGLVAGTMVALPLVLTGGVEALTPTARKHLAWLMGAAGLALAGLALLRQTGELQPYTTIGWGLAAIAVFVVGLFDRLRPYRLLGLVLLALCVPRVFLVDLHDTLHRILAFIALGGVLLWVGFSYHRFRYLIVEDEIKPPAKP